MAEFIDLHAYTDEQGNFFLAVFDDHGEHVVTSTHHLDPGPAQKGFGTPLTDKDGFHFIRIQADEIEKL